MQISALLSIKPKYSQAIFNGSKHFEYRRKLFAKADVSRIIVYESSPTQKVVGEFTIDKILADSPQIIWEATKHVSGIDYEKYSDYFSGLEKGFAIKIGQRKFYQNPLDLFSDFGIKSPPQSFMYI